MRIALSLVIVLACGHALAEIAVDDRVLAIRHLLGDGRYDEAFNASRTFVETAADRPSFYVLLAEAGQYAGREREADSLLLACIRKGWAVGEAVNAMAWLDVHRARWLDAYTHFQAALDYGGNPYVAYAGIQEMHEKLHGRDAAISHLLALSHEHDRSGPVWYALALAYWSQWDLTKASDAIEQALRSGPRDPRVDHLHLAIQCAAGPDLARLRRVDRAYRDADGRGDWEGMAFLRWVRMNAFMAAALPESAGVECREALHMVRGLGMLGWRGQFVLQSARDAAGHGDIPGAIAATDSATEYFRRAGGHDGILAAYALRLDLLLDSFRYADALDYCSRMLLQLDDRADPRLHAGAAIDAAWILSKIGGQRIAIVLGIRAEATLESMLYAAHDRCRLNTTLASIHASLGDSALALRYGRTALRFARSMRTERPLIGSCEGVLGEIQLQCGTSRNARVHFQRQWEIGRASRDPGEQRNAALAMAHTYDVRTEPNAVASWAATALGLATRTGDRLSEKECRILLGRVATLRREHGRARAEFERAYSCLEAVRQLRFLCSLTPEMRAWYIAQFADLADALVDIGAVRRASAIVSRARMDVQNPLQPLVTGAGMDRDDLRSLERSRRATSSLVHRTMLGGSLEMVAFPDSSFRALCTFFARVVPRFLQWERMVRPERGESGLTSIGADLPCAAVGPEEIAIDLVFRSDHTTFLGITRDTVAACRIPLGRSGFAALARSITSGKDVRDQDADPVTSGGMRLRVLEPALRMIDLIAGTRRHLSIIGDGPHTLIPFEALVHGETANGEGRPLIERFTVTYRPALALALTQSSGAGPPDDNGRVLVVGDVSLPLREPGHPGVAAEPTGELHQSSGVLQSLPGTLREVSLVEDHFQGRVDILRGREATQERFRASAPEYWIIHLGTHGAARSAERTEHVLYLAPSAGSAGTVGPGDILPLELKGSLVVLPVCSAGQMSLTEDVESIAHAFLEAGAGSVLAARWSVDDDLAVEFLSTFYGALSAGATKADAVRSAMQTMIARGHHAYRVWAGFQLFGDGGPLSTPGTRSGPDQCGWVLIVLASSAVLSMVGGFVWRKRRLSRVTSRS